MITSLTAEAANIDQKAKTVKLSNCRTGFLFAKYYSWGYFAMLQTLIASQRNDQKPLQHLVQQTYKK